MPTNPVQMRLTDEDKEVLERIRARNGLLTLSATVRFCAAFTDRNQLVQEQPARSRKKSKSGG